MTDTVGIQAEQLAQLCKRTECKLVTAESCTGGGLAEILTRTPGSSAWFERGFVTYSNVAKVELLDVNSNTLERYGAVSEKVALEMAEGALHRSHADLSVAITGIAGPDGWTMEKPVGTVCFAWHQHHADGHATSVHFRGDRQQVRQQACLLAMQGLIDILQKQADLN